MRAFLFVVLIAALVVPAFAHHSFYTFYYMDKMMEIEGVVKSLKIVNPHSEMTVEVTDKDGAKVLWRITATAGGIVGLQKVGWKAGMLVGTHVKVEGHPPRKEGGTGLAGGKVTLMDKATLPDGKEYPAGTVLWLGGGGGIPIG